MLFDLHVSPWDLVGQFQPTPTIPSPTSHTTGRLGAVENKISPKINSS
jgi:hypothetical protein